MKTWRQIDRQRVAAIRFGERLFLRLYKSLRNDLKKQLASVQTTDDILHFAEKYEIDRDKVLKAYENLYLKAALPFAKRTYNDLRKTTKKGLNEDLRDDYWTRSILKYVNSDLGEYITASIRNQYKGVQSNARKAVDIGARKGMGALEMADELIRLQGKMDDWKALRIVRTETMRASNAGATIGAAETGIELEKEWLATDDSRTRDYDSGDFSHRAMDGVRVGMNESFNVDGELLDYPGDPNGSEGNTINCRCAIAFVPKDNPFA